MKKIILPVASFTLILFSCNNVAEPVQQKPAFDSSSASLPVEDNIDPDAAFNYVNTSLANNYESTRLEKFSNDSTEDNFTIIVPKGSINKTKTTLRVTSKDGKVVYEHVFATTELINDYDLSAIKSDKEMADYIIKNAGEIISGGIIDVNNIVEESFLKVASKEEFTNYDLFMEMKKKDRRLLNYTLNRETHFYLGYSDKEKKVVTIIECC